MEFMQEQAAVADRFGIVLLLLGIQTRWAARLSGWLLLAFALGMTAGRGRIYDLPAVGLTPRPPAPWAEAFGVKDLAMATREIAAVHSRVICRSAAMSKSRLPDR